MTQSRRLHPLERRVLQTIQEHDLIPPDSTVVVAVSGGVDSLALMHILHALAPRLRCTLHIATLDHRLRGEAGAADAAFVAEQAAALGLACTVGQRDVRKTANHRKLSIETAARKARYMYLKSTARRVHSTLIVLAHHSDDQAETVLMRLLRGASLQGLVAMRWRIQIGSSTSSPAIIRPLLNISRQQLEVYCNEKGLYPREDETNLDTYHRRNRVRLEVLPYLRTLNPRVNVALNQLAANAAIDNDFINDEMQKYLDSTVIIESGTTHPSRDWFGPSSIHIRRDAFANLHPSLQQRMVVWAYRKLLGSNISNAATLFPTATSEIEYKHVLSCIKLILEGKVGKRIDLPGKLSLRADYEYAHLEDAIRARDESLLFMLDLTAVMKIPSTMTFPAVLWQLRAEIVDDKGETIESENDALREQDASRKFMLAKGYWYEPEFKKRIEMVVCLPTTATVTLRGRREGDRFAPKGMDGHTQKIKQWMIDRKIPAAVRDHVPLLDVDGQIAAILWGDAWAVAEPFRADRALREGEQYVRFTVEM
jgi:tRNA(Ile)-lysidine synthase